MLRTPQEVPLYKASKLHLNYTILHMIPRSKHRNKADRDYKDNIPIPDSPYGLRGQHLKRRRKKNEKTKTRIFHSK